MRVPLGRVGHMTYVRSIDDLQGFSPSPVDVSRLAIGGFGLSRAGVIVLPTGNPCPPPGRG